MSTILLVEDEELNRTLVKNSPYAQWYASLDGGAQDAQAA